ncbi:MAG: response regulator [Proteobacteria bacterium]|nr:response regulator [Pseudomonadota bacterium]MBU1583680.1 response regulator [Pseudomonadota bacterium]MBU2630668.1 response regulator [Pseudomonadota bacterium]
MKILVVDDELVSRKKMMKIVSDFGQCEGVKDGKAAISAVKTALEDWKLYTFITLDISMPDISGTQVLSTIRKLEEERGLEPEEKAKILMVTSHSDIETVKACVGKCDGYVIKPFNKDVLVEKMKKIGIL